MRLPDYLSPRAAENKRLREEEKKKKIREKAPNFKVKKAGSYRTGDDIGAKRKPIREFEKHEHATARGFSDGRLTPGSGNKHIKGDVDTPLLRVENKCTGKTQYAFKAEVWNGIAGQARRAGKEPAYAIQMEGLPPLIVVEEKLLQEWHNELLELRKFKEAHGG